jgi:3-hydroxy acid dehydrogenase / malonic semialdehyde reductase
MNSKIALITGATAGIGEATALKFASEGYNVIITGRRSERLLQLAKEIEKKNNVKVLPLVFDVRYRKQVEEAINNLTINLTIEWKSIDVLVNTAGLASGLSTIDEGDIEDWEVMIDTNIKGLLYISRAIMPLMIQNKKGQIINIGSIAGKEAYLKGNVYCATKHAVDALTKSMRIDLLPHQIRVTGIHPGAVETEFSLVRYKGDKRKAEAVYWGFEPLVAADIAETIYFVASRPAHVNINDIIIMPTAQASTSHILKANA